MQARRSQVANPGKERTLRALLPETVVRTGIQGIRNGDQDPLLNQGRNRVLVRDLIAPSVTRIILESVGRPLEPVLSVDRRGI